MTEYDFSPEAYDRYMATQTRISNWVDNVTQSMQMPSPSPQFSSGPQQPRSRPTYSQQHTHSQTHSRSNSNSRSHSRERPTQYNRDYYRPRSHSHSNGRPQATRSYTIAHPIHSRTYSYAMHQPPPPIPIPVPQPVPYLHPPPRRSRTLPTQQHHIVYHTYDAPRGGSTYVIGPPVVGGIPPQLRMQNAVRTPHSFFPRPNGVVLTTCSCCVLFWGRLRRRNGPSHYSSACLRTSDLGGFPLLAPRQSPSTHHQGGTGEGAASEFPVYYVSRLCATDSPCSLGQILLWTTLQISHFLSIRTLLFSPCTDR